MKSRLRFPGAVVLGKESAVAWLRIAVCALLIPAFAGAADLTIQRLALHDYEDGPLIAGGYEYLPGETVWMSGRVTGFSRAVVDKEEALDHVRLTWQLRATDPGGILIGPPLRGAIEETLRPEDKTWIPKFVVNFSIPQYAVRGIYKIAVTIRDDVSKSEVPGQIEFRVRGDDPPPADVAFGQRNFRFLAKEDDRFALRPPVYKQGASLFARFDIVGHKFDGNNHFAVEYGISILSPPNAEGVSKALFKQESAATESGESFYPQRWVPGGFRIDLDKDVPVGEHTLVLTLRDKVAGTTQEFQQTFTVQAQ
jgi:hypothetical protein